MHRRHDKFNIPIELLRAFVTIKERGSFTEAAEALGLTQPAISAQIKRLQQIIGGDLFAKSGVSLVFTEKGEFLSNYATRIIALNDQAMEFAGQARARQITLGLPIAIGAAMLSEIFNACKDALPDRLLHLHCNFSVELRKNLESGFLDAALLFVEGPSHLRPQAHWNEPAVWVCSRSLLLSPGAPIPIVSWTEGTWDHLAIGAIEGAGASYTVVFTASDLADHFAAVRAGVGYLVLPRMSVPPDLKIAHEHYLPALPNLPAGLYLREGADERRLAPLVRALEKVFRERSAQVETRAREQSARRAG